MVGPLHRGSVERNLAYNPIHGGAPAVQQLHALIEQTISLLDHTSESRSNIHIVSVFIVRWSNASTFSHVILALAATGINRLVVRHTDCVACFYYTSKNAYSSTARLNTAPAHTSFVHPLSDCHNPAGPHMSLLLSQPQQRPAQQIPVVDTAYGPHVILKAVGSTSHGKYCKDSL